MTDENYSQKIGNAIKGLFIIGGLMICSGCGNPQTNQSPFSKIEKLKGGIEVKASYDNSGRKLGIYQDNLNDYPKGVFAVDTNKDGQFDEIRINIDKKNLIGKYANIEAFLDRLEGLYDHAFKNGFDKYKLNKSSRAKN